MVTEQSSLIVSRAGPLPLRQAWLVLAVVFIAEIMDLIDSSVANLAGPSIRADLGGGVQALEWTVNAYTLTYAVLLLTGAGDGVGKPEISQALADAHGAATLDVLDDCGHWTALERPHEVTEHLLKFF